MEADFYVGLDLGKQQDYTALAVIQRVEMGSGTELHLRYLDRYKRYTKYTDIANRLKRLLYGPPFTDQIGTRRARTELVVDKTGVGDAVLDIFAEKRLRFSAVTISGVLKKAKWTGEREYTVPKRELVKALQVPFEGGTLKVAKGLSGWPDLREELLLFRRKQNPKTAHIRYEHWRASDHDDLVLAAALACWKATYKARP